MVGIIKFQIWHLIILVSKFYCLVRLSLLLDYFSLMSIESDFLKEKFCIILISLIILLKKVTKSM